MVKKVQLGWNFLTTTKLHHYQIMKGSDPKKGNPYREDSPFGSFHQLRHPKTVIYTSRSFGKARYHGENQKL